MFLIAFVCHLRFSYDYETSTLELSVCAFEGRAMEGGVCLFGLISIINSVSQKSLTALLILFKSISGTSCVVG